MKKGFTLAEVLITLGIIGIVAAMTMPMVVEKVNKHVVENRLKKFYSAINQAVMMAEADYGDKKIWYSDLAGAQIDKDGKPIPGSSDAEKWFNKYLAPYMKIVKSELLSDGSLIVYFADGSALSADGHTTRDWKFYPGKPDKCSKLSNNNKLGICAFYFTFCPACKGIVWTYHTNKGFEPWKYSWTDGSLEGLKRSCYTGVSRYDASVHGRAFCTAVIEQNNWKIPDDYPYKVRY